MQSGIRTLPVEGRFERIISVDVTPLSVEDSIPGARTAAILAWWREAQAPLGYVPKSRFDIIEHLELAPNLFLAARERNDNYRYLVRGEAIIHMFGVVEPSDLDRRGGGTKRYLHSVSDHYDRVTAANYPHLCEGTLQFSVMTRSFVSLDCPLTDDNGAVTHILGCAELI